MECRFCGSIRKSSVSKVAHEVRCLQNPDRKISKGNTGKTAWNKGKSKDTDSRIEAAASKIRGKPGRFISEEERLRIGASMKLAHREGRAWNIDMNRWKGQPSYAEKFFMDAITNHFEDTAVQREVWFLGYVLDFVWEHKKCVIEIDGKQHEQPAQRERDIRKDALLKQHGYRVLRIRWSDMCSNPQEWIEHANKFIGIMA